MTLKTGMLVGIVGTEDIGVLIQIRASSNTCIVKLNNGKLKKNVPLEDVEEARDMTDTKEKKSPIRLGGAAPAESSPTKTPTKLAALSVDTRRSTDKLSTSKGSSGSLEVGDSVRARCNGGSRWFPGKIIKVHRDGTYDVEYSDGDIEKKMSPSDVEAVSKLKKSPRDASSRKRVDKVGFEVGDKVKARYKGGTKLFSGKIARVRSDGTYDVNYDDGDAETGVAETMIEANSPVPSRKQESDEESPKRTTSKKGDFRVDQSIKARYKGGKKLFPGQIKKVHSDGTYDIRYEDGDEEKRVKGEYIEALESAKPVSDEERKSSKGGSCQTKTLTVGKKVKARYKKGKRLFPGKISRVRSDGTYDIDYDDGEVETRVEASQIEVSDNDDEDMFADSDDDKKRKAPATAKKGSWEVGDRVKAHYGKGKRLFPGRISKVYLNGTYDIAYDDGDSETRVDASLIEGDVSKREKEKSPKSQDSPRISSTKRTLRIGDTVQARYKGGTKFFSGKITRERMDGTFDIRYEDGDNEERVKTDHIELVSDVDQAKDLKSSNKKQISFKVGDIVKAPFQKGNKLFRGKISRVRSDGTYDVVFDDGGRDTHVPGELIQSEEQPTTRDLALTKKVLKVGDAVKARYKKGKKLFYGKVARVRSDGTYDIEYDDGDVELKVEADMIEVPESKKRDEDDDDEARPTLNKRIQVGDKVRARCNNGSKLFLGEITAVHRDGTYDVRYDDGDKEKHVKENNIELEEDRKEPSPIKKSPGKLKVGDLVQANYKNGVKMFPGKISRVHSDGTYDVTFKDGDSERRVPRSRIKPQESEDEIDESSQKKKTGFSIGDAVKAKYKNGTKFFPGKIVRVRSDGTYDIVYDDGDEESRIDATRIVGLESESAKGGVNSPRSPQQIKRYEVGDAIKAHYKKGSKLFPGKISRVRSDGTYDIKYDDGDVETYVESTLIEDEEKAASKSRGMAAEKKAGFAVGDKINARYNGGPKWFPGKISKARLDGTFDVQYDDGDVALRLNSSAIEAVPDSKPKKSKPDAKASSEKDDIFGDSDSDGKTRTNSPSIKVGDVVDANFKQKGKFHRGKVTRVRSDGTFDIEYDVGASEERVRSSDVKLIGGNQESSDDTEVKAKKKTTKSVRAQSSDSDDNSTKKKKSSLMKPKTQSSSASSDSDHDKSTPLKKGSRVTYRKGENTKSRRIGIVRRVHSNGSCDIEYDDGDKAKRIAKKMLIQCSDSEDSDSSKDKKSHKRGRDKTGPTYRRHERVLTNWHRSSKLSKPRMTSKWTKATVLEKNSDGTYTIRYSDGIVEEDVPQEALKSSTKKKGSNSNSSENSDGSDASGRRQKRKTKRNRPSGMGTESLFLLEQLAMTLFEEGVLKKKPKLVLLRSNSDSSSSESSSTSSVASGSSSSKSSKKKTVVDKVLKRLFDASLLQNYRQLFKSNDAKGVGKIPRSKIIAIVEELITASKSTNGNGRANQGTEENHSTISSILTEWFATHDDLRAHRHFEFKTLMLAFAYAKSRVIKLRMEQSVATVLEGRFASYHENKRQLELWQQKLGFRGFETLQRHFHEHALPNMIPSRIRVSELSLIFEEVSRSAMPNKPLAVYLQQHKLFPHHTLSLPEFLCCYYQLYGSTSEHSTGFGRALELRPVAFVASCLFSNGDSVCKRHGDLVRRLSIGRTQSQLDLILRFREAFESLLSTDTDTSDAHEEPLLATSQLSAFAARVAPDPTLLDPAMTLLRKRSAAVSLVEIYGSCGFIIDELTSAPTIRNAIDKMRMRVELAEVRRIISLFRNMCLKILRFPNNADYWRLRADSTAFQQKIGRFDGATSLLEAVGFVEYQKAHYELRGARNMSGKRVAALEKATLDSLREKCAELDRELSLFDGVESISSLLQRIAQTREREGNYFTLDECQAVLKYLSTYIENVLKNPKDSRCWRIREANSTFQRQIGYLPYSAELMESVGFELRPSLHGNVFVLRGTDTSGRKDGQVSLKEPPTTASLSNFSFTSVSSHTEWFLWRRKQEIESLLEDNMRYLHDIVGQHARSTSTTGLSMTGASEGQSPALNKYEAREATYVSMYPYGTNALEAFNTTSIQQQQLEMMRRAFDKMDVDQKGFLLESDFYRVYGSASTLPVSSRFESFDIGKDGQVDFADFVAALGPLLDHSYELTTDKNGEKLALFFGIDGEPTLCEATSILVGDLRLGASYAEALAALELTFDLLSRIIQEPSNQSLWVVNDNMPIGSKVLRFPAGRKLLELVGFRESTEVVTDGKSVRTYELQPQRVRFKTSSTSSEVSQSLDTATISRLGTIAAMLGGHYRGLKNASVSDISAVSRAISAAPRCSEPWIRVVQLAAKCLGNIVNQPENTRYRELNTTTNTYLNVVSKAKGGLELMLSIGFRETDSGTLVIPSDTRGEDIAARQLELDVGLALLRSKMTGIEHAASYTELKRVDHNSKYEQRADRKCIKDTSNSQNELHRKLKKDVQKTPRREYNQQKRGHLNQTTRGQSSAAASQSVNAAKRLNEFNNLQQNQRPATSRTRKDPIENEILSAIPASQELEARGNKMKSSSCRRSGRTNLSNGLSSAKRTQGQRRPPNIPPPAGGNTMVLAENAEAGSDIIVVQKGQFVLRGACVRIGAEIRDLYEERIVVQVFSDDHCPGQSKFRLGAPLRFFHPAKELVSTIALHTVELVKRLEISDAQTIAREIIRDVISNAILRSTKVDANIQTKLEEESRCSELNTTLVTSFEHMTTVPLASSKVRVGPSMRYFTTWSKTSRSNGSQSNTSTLSIVRDLPSDRKLRALWEGLVLQAGISNKKVRLGTVRDIIPRNAYLSLLLSTAQQVAKSQKESSQLSTKSDDFQLTYDGFKDFFGFSSPESQTEAVHEDEESDIGLQLPLAYLRKHFQTLSQSPENFADGYKCVQVSELLQKVYKDIQDHPPVVSDDSQENQAGMEITISVCHHIENAFDERKQHGRISWPELAYFVRYSTRLVIPELLPVAGRDLLCSVNNDGDRDIAEVILGMHSSRMIVLCFDGSVEIWNLSTGNDAQLESRANVLFSVKENIKRFTGHKNATKKDIRVDQEDSNSCFMQSWMDANQVDKRSSKLNNRQTSARVHQFKRSADTSGALVQFCAWDSMMCVNSSILQEPRSGSFRFFRLTRNWLSPVRQVTVEHATANFSLRKNKDTNTIRKDKHSGTNAVNISSSGVVKHFEITTNGSQIVFLTGAEAVLWVACAGTGGVLCSINMLTSPVEKCRVLFRISDECGIYGETQIQVYATLLSKSYQHVGMWTVPSETGRINSVARKKIFTFGDFRIKPVVQLVVTAGLLFVASKDGSVIVWSTLTSQTTAISPLLRLQIPLHGSELQSICCQTLTQFRPEICRSMIHVDESTVAEVDRWEVEVLQRFDTSPLRFALYLFDDGEVLRVAVTDRFDVRYATLDDPAFELYAFLEPNVCAESSRTRRVPLHKHQIVRVVFVALYHLRDGVFAQKSIQEFFEDFDRHGIMRTTRDSMKKFATSYEESVTVALQAFYRKDDNENIELTSIMQTGTQQILNSSIPVVVVGATLCDKISDQVQFQVWKLAMDTLIDEDESEFESKQTRIDRAKRVLALRSCYCLEAARLVRIRKDLDREKFMAAMNKRHFDIVKMIEASIRGVIMYDGRPDAAAENLLEAVRIFALASLDSQTECPAEFYFQGLFRHLYSTKRVKMNRVPNVREPQRVNLGAVLNQFQTEKYNKAWFTILLNSAEKEIQRFEKETHKGSITWEQLNVLVRHIQASTVNAAGLGALFVDLGLINAFDTANGYSHEKDREYTSTLSLPALVKQLHHFFIEDSTEGCAAPSLEMSMATLLSPRKVVEFIVECTNFSSFYYSKMTDLRNLASNLADVSTSDTTPENIYVVQLKLRQWQQALHDLAHTQNQLHSDIYDCEIEDTLEPTVENVQLLKRFLKTPLPHVSPNVSSITLGARCESLQCRDRLVVNATGRLDRAEFGFVPLSMLYIFMDADENAEQKFQQELTFFRKVQHLRVREYFLPAYLDLSNAPILAAVNAPMAWTCDSEDIRCIVTESLSGWTSLSECVKFMRSSIFSASHWMPIFWFWSLRVLMALLAMQNERFSLTTPIDMDMLLISPDGLDLRMCSLAGGVFIRFGENGDDEETLSRSMTRVFGEFLFELLQRCLLSDDTEDVVDNTSNSSLHNESDNDEDRLSKMRRQLIHLLGQNSSKRGDDNNDDEKSKRRTFLTDFSSISQIVGQEKSRQRNIGVDKLCRLALLALQPLITRPGLQSLWIFVGCPQMDKSQEEITELATLSRQMTSIVELQRALDKVLQILYICSEECDDERSGEHLLGRVIENWVALLERLFRFKHGIFKQNDTVHDHVFDIVVNQVLDNDVPRQLSGISMRVFTQCSKYGEKEQWRQAIQSVLQGFANVLQLVETHTSLNEIRGNALAQRMVLQIIISLRSMASGQMPTSRQCNHMQNLGTEVCTLSRFHRDIVANAVLWRLSEPLLRDLLTIENTPSKYTVLLQWLDSRRPSFGFSPAENAECGSGTSNKPIAEIELWWSGHSPLLPQHASSCIVDSEAMIENTDPEHLMTARYLRCIYDTLEIEFKLMSGVIPKFRLGALQEWFGPVYLERKRCYPMVFVRPLVATVWRDLAFERFLCSLLRDGEEKILLGGLSLLECCTRIFRYDVLRSPRTEAPTESTQAPTTAKCQSSFLFSCPEQAFAMHLCSKTIVFEVKRVLDTTTRALKVLGESGTSSASRSQHPLVSILCVAMSLLVNCLHGGDRSTQFWGVAGIDQLIVAHCKANSLPFVKVRDSNMINQVLHQGRRLAQHDGSTKGVKWSVFTSAAADDLMSRSSAFANRHCSPFRLLLEEIVSVGSNRCIGLTRTLILSRTFREESVLAGIPEDPVVGACDCAWQRDLISSGDYGKLSHVIDLARDITELNGTTSEQVQLIIYTRALFLNHTANVSVSRASAFAQVCKEIWSWVEAAWRVVALQASSNVPNNAGNANAAVRAYGDVVVVGLRLLHSIVSHTSLTLEDIVELTTVDAAEGEHSANVLHDLISWIVDLPHGVSRYRSILSVLVENSVHLLINSVRTRRYDEVALATLDTCVDLRALLGSLGKNCAITTGEESTIVSIEEKQQLWSMLLFFDSRVVTSRILATNFLDDVVISRLLSSDVDANIVEDQLIRLNQKLEGVMFLETLVHASSRHEKSVNTHMLFGEVCKLLIHHDAIMKEAQFVRKASDPKRITLHNNDRKHVDVSKRVMQLVCCVCIDFSSQTVSRLFQQQLESVGVPAWVIAFHQKLRGSQAQVDASDNDQHLASRVDLFWRDWQGDDGTLPQRGSRSVVQESSQKSDRAVKDILAITTRRTPRPTRSIRATSAAVQPHKSEECVELRLKRPMVAVSPVKMASSGATPPRWAATAREEATTMKRSVVHTLLSIDADSALRLVRTRDTTGEEAFDSDASSLILVDSSSDGDDQNRRTRAQRKTNPRQKRKTDSKASGEENEDVKLERDSSNCSPERPRRRHQQHHARKRSLIAAASPRTQQRDALREIFRKYDVDGDGAISFIDLRRALDRQTVELSGRRLSDLEIQQWITEKDCSGRGVVGLEDFLRAFSTQT